MANDELPFDTHEMGHEDAVNAVAALDDDVDEDTLRALHAHEVNHPTFVGGRRTVKNAIEERLGEEGVDDAAEGLARGPAVDADAADGSTADDDAPEEEEEGPEPGAPGSTVLVRIGSQEHDAIVIREEPGLLVEIKSSPPSRHFVQRKDWRAKG